MARKLKVFRTPIGFHDAYVAAPTQKAALEAWGSDADLFNRGMAELVTDEALTREPLERPGEVIRRPRGSAAEHLAALPEDKPASAPPAAKSAEEDEGPARRRAVGRNTRSRPKDQAPSTPAKPAPRKKAETKPKPRPSRGHLDEAEAALAEAETRRDAELAKIRQREQALQRERHALERRHEDAIGRKAAAVENAEERYRAALAKWRGEQA